jgi:uncharacterized membrane protein
MNLFVAVFAVLVLIALIVWAAPLILKAIKIPDNVATVIWVGLVCLIVLWLLGILTGYASFPSFGHVRS